MSALILWVGLALADCSLDSAVDDVREKGKKDAYDCLMESPEAGTRITRALLEYPSDPRLSRALALWMLQRADTPFDPVHVGKLSADDKRLLADGVRARRGRKSPVPQHEAVFRQFDWYQPVATYTDGRLKPGDKEQIALLNAREPRSTVLEPPAAEPTITERLAALFSEENLAKIIPGTLVVIGLIGVGAWVRRPKTD